MATKILLDHFQDTDVDHTVLDIARPLGRRGLGTVVDIGRWLVRPSSIARIIKPKRVEETVVYMQIGQGISSLLRDFSILKTAVENKLPLVIHVHGSAFREGLDRLPLSMRTKYVSLLKNADAAIVLSESLVPMFDRVIERRRIRVVENGVEDGIASIPQNSTVRPKNILFLSNIIDTKGYQEFLMAAKIAMGNGDELQFRLAGAKTKECSVDPDSYISDNQLTNTTYVGPVMNQEKFETLAWADMLVLPTYYPIEGQPITILEAMTCGLPIVTTRRGGIPDIVEDGKNGLFVEPKSPKDVYEKIRMLVTDSKLYRRISEKNRDISKKKYTGKAHGMRVVSVFHSVVDDRKNLRRGHR